MSRRSVLPWTALAAAGVLTGGWSVMPAPAAGAATPTGPSTSVTVFLTAPNAPALSRLSAVPVTSRTDRLAQLRSLVPSAAQHAAVVSVLRSEGFQVGRQSTWSVTATAPESVVTSTFGSRPSAGADPGVATLRAATGPLATLPAALSGLASAAYPTTGGPAAFHHQATGPLAGPDFRKADTPAGVTPSTGTHDSGETIATLQLSTYTASDLTNYATSHGLPDPVASGQYQSENVDGGATDNSGDIEVDLDQESILSTAPSANQLAYFAPNTEAGFADVFSSAYDDVTGAPGAAKPNPHITAMSVSWGECEAMTGADQINTFEPILESLVAAGVTLFDSSGDDGIYDCRSTSGTGSDNSQEDVDFPASSPVAIAVGGTNLSAATSAPNTGTNWTEKSWTCTSTSTCENTQTGTGGTGGGVSGAAFGAGGTNGGDFAGFAEPGYQSTYVTNGAFADATKRMVPDIAADGDPSTGFELYTSDSLYTLLCGGHTCQVGGTSLAAPISAAQLANLLGDNGRTTGIGDIHSGLYKAYSATAGLAATDPAKAFRDVTVGSNGAAANASKDPSVKAGVGYDTNTGLGGVLWGALKPYLLGAGQGPAVTAALTPTANSTPRAVGTKATWTVTARNSPVSSVSVTLKQGRTTVFTATTARGSRNFAAKRGLPYRLTVVATDSARSHHHPLRDVHGPSRVAVARTALASRT